MSDKSDRSLQRNYLVTAFCSIFIILFVKWVWPTLIPFETFFFWSSKGTLGEWLTISLPVFAVGLILNLLYTLFQPSQRKYYRSPQDHLKDASHKFAVGTLMSLWAGVVEEIAFRWLIFMGSIAIVRLGNWLFFGCLGFGIAELAHNYLLGPLANWTTGGYLKSYIFSSHGWSVGASMLYTNAIFREGHSYQGFVGYTNSWFMGMFFFWIMFTYGLPAAIVIHFTYNFLINIFSTLRLLLR